MTVLSGPAINWKKHMHGWYTASPRWILHTGLMFYLILFLHDTDSIGCMLDAEFAWGSCLETSVGVGSWVLSNFHLSRFNMGWHLVATCKVKRKMYPGKHRHKVPRQQTLSDFDSHRVGATSANPLPKLGKTRWRKWSTPIAETWHSLKFCKMLDSQFEQNCDF